MLKPYLSIIIILISLVFSSSAQVRKVYMTADDRQTADSSKASSYVLYQKAADSGWVTYKYAMNDTILIKGTFKDENLTIPHGKFTYYKLVKPTSTTEISYNYVKHKIDTVKLLPKNYVSSAGCFINGEKEGTWIDNDLKYGIQTMLNFQHNKLNGLYQEYRLPSKTLITEGSFIDDRREGRWISFELNGDTLSITNFKDGIGKKVKPQMPKKHIFIETKPTYDIIQYLNTQLANTKFTKSGTFYVVYHFVVTEEGKLVEPRVTTVSDLEIDTAIIDKMLACPNWECATIDGTRVTRSISVNLQITTSKKYPVEISYPFHSDYIKY